MNEQILKFSNILDISNQLDRNQKSWCLEDFDQDSISTHQLELDQSQPLNKLASFEFKKIELDYECELDPQLCDLVPNIESMLTSVSLSNLDPITKLTLILIPIDHEIESLIVDSHISLMDHECELKFFDLEPTIELKLTLESKLDFPELVLVPEPIILEPISITSSSYILLVG